jgi:hypothetical protein
MIKYNAVSQKPNSDTSWNKLLTDAILNEITLIGVLGYKGSLSADGLTQYTEIVFHNQDDYDDYFKNNPLLLKWHSDRIEYNTLHGINTIYENTETIADYYENIGLDVTNHDGSDALSTFKTIE